VTAPVPDTDDRAAKIVHDLNNLVSVILGYSNLLVEQLGPDDAAGRMAGEVQAAAARAAELSRQLVELRAASRAGAPVALAAATALPIASVPAARITVLVVEDDKGVRKLAESVLKRGGYQVLAAADAAAALEVCEKHPGGIELLLADVVLPGGGAAELVARARKLRPALRVLFMSGYDAGGIPEPGNAFLPKPFTAETLTAAVRAVLAAR